MVGSVSDEIDQVACNKAIEFVLIDVCLGVQSWDFCCHVLKEVDVSS